MTPDINDPLNDDGAALRLAAKLKMSIVISNAGAVVFYGTRAHLVKEKNDGDICKAIRRAIVKAAEAILAKEE